VCFAVAQQHGMTPLHFAAFVGGAGVVSLLLARGACATTPDKARTKTHNAHTHTHNHPSGVSPRF
jgi:ankyrin repeat protein